MQAMRSLRALFLFQNTILSWKTKLGSLGIELGGIWGEPLNGRVFQLTEGTSGNYTVYTDKINSKDNWGGKVKLTTLVVLSSGMDRQLLCSC
jgi:hypothetical protein